MARPAVRQLSGLRVVERPPAYEREVSLFNDEDAGNSHSLHYAVAFPDKMLPELAHGLLDRFTERGDMVLDPFCGIGTVGLEGAFMGRVPVMSDLNLLALRMAQAALYPVDITEVTLRLQMMALNKPVDSTLHDSCFEPFFDIRTFCEMVNLRKGIRQSYDRVTQFLEFVVLGLLHGHSSGYLSVYTFPQVSISPEQQKKLNAKRRQTPDYRSVLPRVLRRSAYLLRDGIPSVLQKSAEKGGVSKADARNLNFLQTAMIDNVITAPPLPGDQDFSSDMWLRLWFSGLAKNGMYDQSMSFINDTSQWLDFMNETLLELARVIKPGGRAVFVIPQKNQGAKDSNYDEVLKNMVEDSLYRFWDTEGTLVNSAKGEVLENSLRSRTNSVKAKTDRILILRRK